MLTRILTGLVLAPLVVWLVLYLPKALTFVLLGLVAARCADELLRMYADIRPRDRYTAAALCTLLALSPLLGDTAVVLAVGLMPVAWLGLALVQPQTVEMAAQRAALGALALAYVGGLCAMLVAVFAHSGPAGTTPTEVAGLSIGPYDTGRGALLGTFVMVFFGDTGAYFAGRFLGRHKLYELISPKKTLEGSAGGLLASILGGWLTATLFLPQIPLPHALGLGAVCGLVGQVGDLAESLFKRATGTKDSGNLLPGHGGMLDRVDGVLFAAPIVHAYLTLA